MQARVAAVNEGAILADDAKWTVIEKQLTYPPLWLINHWLIDEKTALDWSNHYHEIVESGRMLLVVKSKTIPEAIGLDFQKLYEWIGSTGGTRNAAPQHQAHTPHTAKTETVEEKAAREKKEKIEAWYQSLFDIAEHFFRNNEIIQLAGSFASEQGSPYAAVFANQHHVKLPGLGLRIVRLFENPDSATPFVLPRSTQWTSNTAYKNGDYEKWNNFTWWCKKDHIASGTNAPGTEGGNEFWNKVLLNNVPSSFVFDNPDGSNNVTINITTGDGIADYLRMVAQEFEKNDVKTFFGVLANHAAWKQKTDAYELWSSKAAADDPFSLSPAFRIYSSKVHHIQRRNQQQVDDALAHTRADWQKLYKNYFECLKLKG